MISQQFKKNKIKICIYIVLFFLISKTAKIVAMFKVNKTNLSQPV